MFSDQAGTLTKVVFTFYKLIHKIWMNFVMNSRGGQKKLNWPFKTRLGAIFNNADVTLAVVDRAAENRQAFSLLIDLSPAQSVKYQMLNKSWGNIFANPKHLRQKCCENSSKEGASSL